MLKRLCQDHPKDWDRGSTPGDSACFHTWLYTWLPVATSSTPGSTLGLPVATSSTPGSTPGLPVATSSTPGSTPGLPVATTSTPGLPIATSGQSTTEQLMSLRVVLDTCRTTKRRATIIFVDFRKAFDCLFHVSIPSTLADNGVPPEVIADVMQLYKDTTDSVWTQHGETESFSTLSGVLQGDTLSPFLFITVLDSVLQQTLREEDGFTVKRRRSLRHPETKLYALAYADDIAIISDTPDGAERTFHRFVSSASRLGLEISKPKTEVIHIGDSDPPGPTTFPCGERVSECSEFKYLGVCTASPSHVVDARFDQAWSAMSALKPIFTSKSADRIKIRLFRAAIESIQCYGMESISLTPTLSRLIDSRYRRMLRSALGIFYPDRISNDELFAKTQLPPLSMSLRRRRLRLVGHILRMQTRSKSPLGEGLSLHSCSAQWEDVVLPLRWEVVLTIPERREASQQKTMLRETTRGSAQFVSL
ncbi:hypothetical protein ACOMHN_030303 [Nucella lapillus]